MEKHTQEMYSELYSVLNMLGDEYIDKIPAELYNTIKTEKSETYSPIYQKNHNLLEQNLKEDTLSMIALFRLNYWNDTEEQKEQLKELFQKKPEQYESKARVISYEQPIKQEIQRPEYHQEYSMTEYKEPFWTRLKNTIKGIFYPIYF